MCPDELQPLDLGRREMERWIKLTLAQHMNFGRAHFPRNFPGHDQHEVPKMNFLWRGAGLGPRTSVGHFYISNHDLSVWDHGRGAEDKIRCQLWTLMRSVGVVHLLFGESEALPLSSSLQSSEQQSPSFCGQTANLFLESCRHHLFRSPLYSKELHNDASSIESTPRALYSPICTLPPSKNPL